MAQRITYAKDRRQAVDCALCGRQRQQWRRRRTVPHQLVPINSAIGVAKLLGELLRKSVDDRAVALRKVVVALPGIMPQRLDYAGVQITVAGNQLPEILPAVLEIAAFVRPAIPSVAAAVHGDNPCVQVALPNNAGCRSEIVAHIFDLGTVAPIRAGFDGNDVPGAILDELQVDSGDTRFPAAANLLGNINRQAFQKIPEQRFLLRAQVSVQ